MHKTVNFKRESIREDVVHLEKRKKPCLYLASLRMASQTHRAFCNAHACTHTRDAYATDQRESLSLSLFLFLSRSATVCRLRAYYVVIHGLSQSMLLRQKEAKQKAGKHLA